MARRASSAPTNTASALPSKTLVVDPGAYTIKAGFAAGDEPQSVSTENCHVIPNCIARSRDKKTFIGSQLESCTDFGEMAFKRPVEKGYMVNWDAERAIWEHEFFDQKAKLHCDPSETNLIITESPNAPQALQSNTDQMIFEEFDFASAYRCTAPSLNAWTDNHILFSDPPPFNPLLPTEIMLLIDASHSHTTITPLLRGHPIQSATRRITLGGKHLTSYLAELISLRHFSLIDEPYIVSETKHDACYVSQAFTHDLTSTWKGPLGDRRTIDPSIIIDYVLPDYETLHRGFVRPHDASHAAKLARLGVGVAADDAPKEESFPLANERFVVPELLFSPGDIGVQECGMAETVMQVVEAVPRALWQGLLANVLVVGGSSLLLGFVERVEREVRALAPSELVVRVRRAEDPIKATWLGGARLATQMDRLKNVLITREDYFEHGERWVRDQFATRRIVQEWPSV